mgnify:CR=1 FL=1
MMSSILVATSNPHKVQEIRAVLCPMGLEVCSLDEIGADIPEPIEDEETFGSAHWSSWSNRWRSLLEERLVSPYARLKTTPGLVVSTTCFGGQE